MAIRQILNAPTRPNSEVEERPSRRWVNRQNWLNWRSNGPSPISHQPRSRMRGDQTGWLASIATSSRSAAKNDPQPIPLTSSQTP